MRQQQRIEQLLDLVKIEARQICTITTIDPVAYGVENCVFKATMDEWDEVAIRVPWSRFVTNETDGSFDSRKGLEKEALLTKHCFDEGIPVPEIHKVHYGETVDFIIQDFVYGNDAGHSFEEIGRLVHQLHQIKLPPDQVMLSTSLHEDLSVRIIERTKAFGRYSGMNLPFPDSKEITTILDSYPVKASLLHMDIRLENMIFHNRKIKAIFDWTNALVGDPVLELMRVKEYGLLDDEFKRGYRDFEAELKRVPEIVQWLYQYDTTVMLTLLFFTELDDQVQGSKASDRLFDLYGKMKLEW